MVSPSEGGLVVGFETGEGDIEHFPARHDHDIKTRSNFVAPENLPSPALGEITLHRRPELLCCSHAKPWRGATVGENKEGHEPSVNSGARRVDTLKIRSAPNPLGCRE